MITRVEQAPHQPPLQAQSRPRPSSSDDQHKSEEVKTAENAKVVKDEEEDLSQPISILLRKSTAKAHQAAGQSKGAEWLVKGSLDKEEYVRFLMMLWRVYTAIEDGLHIHQSNPVLKASYQPDVFARADSISSDITTLLNLDPNTPNAWQTHPINLELAQSPPAPLSRYLDRLHELSLPTLSDSIVMVEAPNAPDSFPFDTSSLLLAHAYVRYLGDLSGGQYIRRRIAKVYGLSDANDSIKGDGVRFYIFKNSDGEGNGEAGKADMQRLKDWFRAGMDAGVGDDSVLKEVLMKEANLAFELNQGLFTVLREPSQVTRATQTTHSTEATTAIPPPLPQSTSSTSNATIDSASSSSASSSPVLPLLPMALPPTPITWLPPISDKPTWAKEVTTSGYNLLNSLKSLGNMKYSWLFGSALVLSCAYLLRVQLGS